MMSIFYPTQIESQLERSEYLILCILVNLLQCIKKVSLEALATAFPLPILFDSRRKLVELKKLVVKNVDIAVFTSVYMVIIGWI